MSEKLTGKKLLNDFGKKRSPCLFVIDFDATTSHVFPLTICAEENVFYSVRAASNYTCGRDAVEKVRLTKKPIGFPAYNRAFREVRRELVKGNTYLVNLTFPTPITCNRSLSEIFFMSRAPYKLLFKNKFVVFSPEQFVEIRGNVLRTFPMKGTIDAAIPGAADIILADEKERAEHVTVVDLLRNDVGMVARNVSVERLRYLDEISTHEGRLLQVSSEIRGELDPHWHDRLGDILFTMLPAGSVTGAPKKKTVEIIRQVEICPRGYYTGIFGLYDGHSLDSAVMIRFIEHTTGGALVYKSGGGITMDSIAENEYREMVVKVYVPVA